MTAGYYRVVLIGCALAWFMLGLHFPVLHEMTDHGGAVDATILVAVALITCVAIASLWVLVRINPTTKP